MIDKLCFEPDFTVNGNMHIVQRGPDVTTDRVDSYLRLLRLTHGLTLYLLFRKILCMQRQIESVNRVFQYWFLSFPQFLH